MGSYKWSLDCFTWFKILNKYKPSCIFNLAAETHVDRSIDNPDNFIKTNIVDVYKLLESFKKFIKKDKCKLIHISTDEVYGDILKGRSTEKFPYNPSSPYAASKASSDHLVSSYVRTYKIRAIVTNCSNNYGPHQHFEKLIPNILNSLIKRKKIPIYGNGKNIRDWLFVDDHCDAIELIFNDGKNGETYNLGGDCEISNIDWLT